jgi:hypothetical protein
MAGLNKERLWQSAALLQEDAVLHGVYALPFINLCTEISAMTKLLGPALKFAGDYMDTLLVRVRGQVAAVSEQFEVRYVEYGPALRAMVEAEPLSTMHTMGSVRHSVSRLIWLLDFTEALITNLISTKFQNDTLCDCARAAYEDRLADNHKWFVKKAVRLALYCCPSRERLYQHVTFEELKQLRAALQKPVAMLYQFLISHKLTLAVVEDSA